MARANVLDRAIGWIAPGAGLARMQARAKAEGLERAVAVYDGAARSYRTAGRVIGNSSANAEVLTSLTRLREVMRDLERNNPYARRAIKVLDGNVVGAGIVPTVHAQGERRKKAVRKLIAEHLETPEIDYERRLNLAGIQSLVERSTVRDGECLILREAVKGRPVPLAVRVLEADFLDSFRDGPTPSGGYTFQGVEYDKGGQRVAYWLYNEHPGDVVRWKLPTSRRVPASEVIHNFRIERAGQVRGVPRGAPAIMTLWDLHDFEDAELVRQKVAACFAGFIMDPDSGRPNLGQAAAADLTSRQGLSVDMMEPGTMQRLLPGQDIKFSAPPTTSGYAEFTRAQIRKIAVAFGVPYEALSGDLSQTNFSSGRMGWIEFQREVDQERWHALIPHTCAGIGRWFLDACDAELGEKTGAWLEWTPPRREMIDPTKEIPAARDAVRAGLSTRSEELRKMGLDPELVDTEIAAENARSDKLKLSFDSDGRRPLAGPAITQEVQSHG
jgi:lambda family phage portal protein